MLQGHFVDTLLADTYRNAESSVFYLWSFMRGMTAPIFFTVTGLVFTYLLLKDGRPLRNNQRVKKGLRRGIYLLGVGYLLKVNFPGLLFGYVSPWIFTVDVLHVIGLALIALIVVCALRELLGGSILTWMLVFGTGTFMLDPFFTQNDWSHLPTVLAHYLTRDLGSNFTVVPWLGFAFFGGALGYLLSRRSQWAFTHWFPALLLAFGLTLTWGSDQMLVNLYELTGWHYLPVMFNNNYLFWRLGQVFVTVAIFMWAIPRVGTIPKLITKIGGETLTVYGVHYVILYGTWLGFGIVQLIGYRSLGPLSCVLGAAAFVYAHILLINHIEAVRHFAYVQWPQWRHRQYRILLVWYHRDWLRQRQSLHTKWQELQKRMPSWLMSLAQVREGGDE